MSTWLREHGANRAAATILTHAVWIFLSVSALIWTIWLAMVVAGSNSADARIAAAFTIGALWASLAVAALAYAIYNF